MKHLGGVLVIFSVSVLSVFAGHYLWKAPTLGSSGGTQVREGSGVYTNPLLECDVAQGVLDTLRARLDDRLKKYVDQIQTRATISEVAVYYRDLNNGPTVSINSTEKFIPASLLKVPVLMVIFKHAETDPGILDKKIVFKRNKDLAVAVTQNIKPSVVLVEGQTYTVLELLRHAVQYSDNDALMAAYSTVPQSEYTAFYHDLGFPEFAPGDPDFSLTVKDYATFFRILYNSSYLTQEYSELALKMLTETNFDQGLRAGVPAIIPIAHKFGERNINDGFNQLHDCGIVFLPKNAYLLCVMSRGTDQKELAKVIRDISKYTYDQVSAQN